MFNSKQREFEMRMEHLKESMDKLGEEKKGVEKNLEKAKARISELEEKLAQTEVESLRKEARETLAEAQGLKELYLRKNEDFDSNMQAESENYAKEEVRARRKFNEELAQQKKDTEEYVGDTVETFSETYNYYLNQIKVLMDALGQVATKTGKHLFSGEEVDLKTEFGRRMMRALKQEAETLPQEGGNRVLFGAPEEEEEKKEEPKAEEVKAEEAEAAEAVEAVEAVAAAEAVEAAATAAAVEAAAEEAAKAVEEAVKAEVPVEELDEEDTEKMMEEWAAALNALDRKAIKAEKKGKKKDGDKKKKKKKDKKDKKDKKKDKKD